MCHAMVWLSLAVLEICLMSRRLACCELCANTISINIFNVLGGNWDPTDKKFSSVNSYRQDYLPTCKAFPKDAPHAFGSHKVIKSATVQQYCTSAAGGINAVT